MTALRIIAAIALADLRQRLRVPRTWVVLVALAIASWWSFPPIGADYLTVSIGGAAGARAHYSSAWIGLVIAATQGAMLSLAGFYVVRGTVVRDTFHSCSVLRTLRDRFDLGPPLTRRDAAAPSLECRGDLGNFRGCFVVMTPVTTCRRP